MDLKIKVDPGGNAYVAAIDPTTGEHRKATTIRAGQELTIDIADVLSADQLGFSGVVDSDSGGTVEETPGAEDGKTPADKPGGGNEGSPAAEGQGEVEEGGKEAPEPSAPADQATDPDSPGANAEGGEGGQVPAGGGDLGGAQSGEQPTTSAASEKPLYVFDGGAKVPEEFVLSGLETPDGKDLYHFANDTAGQSATGNRDGVSVYADADDNEQPVQVVPVNTGTAVDQDAERSAT